MLNQVGLWLEPWEACTLTFSLNEKAYALAPALLYSGRQYLSVLLRSHLEQVIIKPSEYLLSSSTLSLSAFNVCDNCPANSGLRWIQKVLSSAGSSLRFSTNPCKIKEMTISTIYITVCYAHAISTCLLLRLTVSSGFTEHHLNAKQ